MRRIARITGRSDDMLIIRGVNVFPSQIEELILRQPELSPHYVLEIEREGRLDAVTVRGELRPDAPAGERARTGAALDLQQRMRSHIGIGVRVELGPPGTIQRSAGKAKRIVDKRTIFS